MNWRIVRGWMVCPFFFSRRRRHTSLVSDWSSDVCSSDLERLMIAVAARALLGDLQQPGSLPAAGDAGALARDHESFDDHGDADVDGERDSSSLREGGIAAAQAQRRRAGAADLGAR